MRAAFLFCVALESCGGTPYANCSVAKDGLSEVRWPSELPASSNNDNVRELDKKQDAPLVQLPTTSEEFALVQRTPTLAILTVVHPGLD